MHFSSVLRSVAIFEATKGALVLLVGGGLFSVLHHRDVELAAEKLVSHFNLNAASRYPKIFLDLAGQMTDGHLWVLAAFAAAYAAIRFVEAYGLWNALPWAEWFAALSGGIYIPFELREVSRHVSWLSVGTLLVNVAIVCFMIYGLRHAEEIRAEQAHEPHT